jgi:hypothetical protein
MTVASDIEAVRNNGSLNDAQKRAAIYQIKTVALLDVIINGKPAPGPIPPLLGRTFTQNGTTYNVQGARAGANNELLIVIAINGAAHKLVITNPPTIPASITGNEKQDLIQAAMEMLEGFD